VPHTTSGAHPFDAAVADASVSRVGIIKGHIALREYRNGADAGVWMYRHAGRHLAHIRFEQVEKNERLQPLSEIGRANEAYDRPMPYS
jgi:hypothetical protein